MKFQQAAYSEQQQHMSTWDEAMQGLLHLTAGKEAATPAAEPDTEAQNASQRHAAEPGKGVKATQSGRKSDGGQQAPAVAAKLSPRSLAVAVQAGGGKSPPCEMWRSEPRAPDSQPAFDSEMAPARQSSQDSEALLEAATAALASLRESSAHSPEQRNGHGARRSSRRAPTAAKRKLESQEVPLQSNEEEPSPKNRRSKRTRLKAAERDQGGSTMQNHGHQQTDMTEAELENDLPDTENIDQRDHRPRHQRKGRPVRLDEIGVKKVQETAAKPEMRAQTPPAAAGNNAEKQDITDAADSLADILAAAEDLLNEC